MSSLHFNYRGAVCLNNIGVSLLEKQNFRQAMTTFADAIAVMKLVFRTESSCPFIKAESKLQSASQRLANPEPIYAPAFIAVISHDDTDILVKPLPACGPSSSTVHAIRIRSSEMECEVGAVDLETSIMLFNFGLAHYCLAKLESKPTCVALKLQNSSLKLFRVAQSILAQRCSMCNDPLQQSRLLRLASMIMNVMILILHEQGRTSDAAIAYQKLVRLGAAVSKLDGSRMDNLSSNPAAAAA